MLSVQYHFPLLFGFLRTKMNIVTSETTSEPGTSGLGTSTAPTKGPELLDAIEDFTMKKIETSIEMETLQTSQQGKAVKSEKRLVNLLVEIWIAQYIIIY